jgi:CBS domain-containing protein
MTFVHALSGKRPFPFGFKSDSALSAFERRSASREDCVKHETASRKFGQQAVAPEPQTAGEIMTTDVISVSIGASVRDVAILLLQKRISAVPVLAADQQLVGMVSEGDLLGRGADDRLARRDWWLTLLKGGQPLAEPLEKLVARPVEDVMHAPVVTIEPLTSLHEIAEILHVHDIKRLPVMHGDRMLGIVSRSDLVRAMATMIPQPPDRSRGGLLSFFAGMMPKDTRLADATALAPPSAAPPDRAPVTADEFRNLVTVSKQIERDDAIAAKQQAKMDQRLRVQAMLKEHLGKNVWATLLERARDAATHGEKSLELLRFPCDLCSDGSRKIDVAETDWPTTLRGEAAEIFTRWERELRPAGFGLTAQIVEYFDGIPGNVALTLTWNPREQAK